MPRAHYTNVFTGYQTNYVPTTYPLVSLLRFPIKSAHTRFPLSRETHSECARVHFASRTTATTVVVILTTERKKDALKGMWVK